MCLFTWSHSDSFNLKSPKKESSHGLPAIVRVPSGTNAARAANFLGSNYARRDNSSYGASYVPSFTTKPAMSDWQRKQPGIGNTYVGSKTTGPMRAQAVHGRTDWASKYGGVR
ncbi:putative serine/threonine-protein kinase MAK [Apostichopus japonicus]|uniref:Putative serine/threonine-protein kinase MAK n=1 Tax=Stichopus japonicus TaxID=307972 RepID=A0A2G8JPR8_STIJA|nr:putative serine/threonine-protein kinase MAK [Apostichopus japonicus]